MILAKSMGSRLKGWNQLGLGIGKEKEGVLTFDY
jgi:hypothetical protein